MFDTEQYAAAVNRVNRKVKERVEQSYRFIFENPEGRAFIAGMIEACKLYEKVETPEEEGARRLALNVRRIAEMHGLLDMWQLAEKEAADFREETKEILEQTEAKEEENYGI